jgi:hypothetical protein
MLDVKIKKRSLIGNLRSTIAEVTFDSTYPTGGEEINPQSLGIHGLDFVLATPSDGYLVEFDHATNKLKVLTPTNASAGHAHTFTGDALVAHSHTENTASAYTQNATTATVSGGTPSGAISSDGSIVASPANEVANGTNLSTLTVRVIAIGI